MGRRRLLWQLFSTYLVITLAALVAIGWFATHALQQFYLQLVRNNLQVRAEVVEGRIGESLDEATTQRLRDLAADFGKSSTTRITIIDPGGVVLVDTDEDPARMENHAKRPEVSQALAGEIGEETRPSATLHQPMMYLAIPVHRHGQVIGVVRTSVPLDEVNPALWRTRWRIASAGVLVAALAALLSLYVSRRVTRPLEEMRQGAERFASGDLSYKLPLPESEEMASLAESLNQMARQLEERIGTIVRQANEQEAVLSSMIEGVLAVDTRHHVISLNTAAARLLETESQAAVGRPLEQVIRNTELRRFASRVLESDRSEERDISLYAADPDRVLQAHGAALRDGRGNAIGAVIVLNDVTRNRQLENMRRDFVANVSHELKTPIASIKGFVETMLDGALDNREDAERFLRIVAKQADRLNSIIEDLLSLAKIEQAEERAGIELEEGRVASVLEMARSYNLPRAHQKQVHINVSCESELKCRMNPPLLEQAISNLLDNAIKYSHPQSEVRVAANHNGHELSIAVADEGVGIAAEHLDRLFERFYRVDKARSRKMGGTGLGLAIVKHIVQAHGGHVEVHSTPGAGSVFTIHLPV